MTPRSLMAIVGLLMAASRAALAAGGVWLQVTAGSQSFFINKESHEQLKSAKPGVERKLYEQPDGKDSGYVLFKKNATVYVVKKGATEVAVTSIRPVQPEAPKRRQTASEPQKTGASVADVAAIVNADPKIPADRKALVLSVMQRLQAQKPKEYARMLAGGESSIKAVAQKINWAADKGGKSDADALTDMVTKVLPRQGSMLTAALDDSKAPAEAPALGDAPPTVQGVADDKANKDSDSRGADLVKALALAINENRAAAEADIARRLSRFMMSDGAYVSEKVKKDANLVKNIEGFIAAWVKEASASDLAQLYAVAGSAGAAPAWVAADRELADFLAAGKRLDRLKSAMEAWTKPGAQGAAGQLQQGSRDEVAAFLSKDSPDQKTGGAAFWAAKILLETRSWGDVERRIAANKPQDATPGTLPQRGGPVQTDPSVGFGFDSLYRNGAVVKQIWAPGDRHSRMVSVKLYTVREGDNLVTKVGVWDITNQSHVFGQNFTLSDSGETTFALDDRIEGYPQYTLKFTPDGADSIITLERAGSKGGGGTLKTSVNELYSLRAMQAQSEGATIDVGGRKYLALGQGGHPGGISFFPADAAARTARGERVAAELHADTNVRTQGRDVNKPGKQKLGSVDGKPYHLAFNSSLGYWQVGEGEGQSDAPRVEKTEPQGAPQGRPSVPERTDSGGEERPQGPQQTTARPSGTPLSDDEVVAQERIYEASGYERNKEVRDGLSEQYKDVFRIYSWIKPSESGGIAAREIGRRHLMVVPASYRPERFIHAPFLKSENDDFIRKKGEIRGIGKYLATTTDLYTGYFDLSKKNEKNPGLIFEIDLECFVDMKKKTFCVKDLVLLEDAAGMAGVSAADARVIKERAQALIKSEGEYTILRTWDQNANGVGPVTARIRGVGTCVLWPTQSPCSNVSNSGHDNTRNQSAGQANAFDKLTIGPDSDFSQDPQSIDNAGTKETVYFSKVSDDKTAALYANDRNFPKAKNWYLTFRVKKRDGSFGRSGFIPVFDSSLEFPGLGAINIKGVELGQRDNPPDITATGEVRRSVDKNKKKGLYYVVEEKNIKQPDSQNKYQNCVGPIVWWGMDYGAAMNACKENGAL